MISQEQTFREVQSNNIHFVQTSTYGQAPQCLMQTVTLQAVGLMEAQPNHQVLTMRKDERELSSLRGELSTGCWEEAPNLKGW